MGSLNPIADGKQESDDSAYVQDEAGKQPEQYRGSAEMLDLSDDVLLLILRNCTAQELKAVGFTCERLATLVLDRSLWVDVDSGSSSVGRRRVRWLLTRALGPYTKRLRLRGYGQHVLGCMGFTDRFGGQSQEFTWQDEERYLCGGGLPVPPTQRRPPVWSPSNAQPTDPPATTPPTQPTPPTARSSCIGPQLTLTKAGLCHLNALCTGLRILELDDCVIDCQSTTIGMFPKGLTRLSLRGTICYNLESKSFLFRIQDFLTLLEELDVSQCTWIEPACILPLSKMPSLRKLYMRECLKLAEFVAYASLATRYGFKTLKVFDLRGCPVGDSEVSSLGWLPCLEELYLSPPKPRTPIHEHAHSAQEKLPEHKELEDWEENEPEFLRQPSSTMDVENGECMRGIRTDHYSNDESSTEAFRQYILYHRDGGGPPPDADDDAAAGPSKRYRAPDDNDNPRPGTSDQSTSAEEGTRNLRRDFDGPPAKRTCPQNESTMTFYDASGRPVVMAPRRVIEVSIRTRSLSSMFGDPPANAINCDVDRNIAGVNADNNENANQDGNNAVNIENDAVKGQNDADKKDNDAVNDGHVAVNNVNKANMDIDDADNAANNAADAASKETNVENNAAKTASKANDENKVPSAANNASEAENKAVDAANIENNVTNAANDAVHVPNNAANASDNAVNAPNNVDNALNNSDNAATNAANAVNNRNNGTGDAVNLTNAPNNVANAPTNVGNASNNADNAANAVNNKNNGKGDAVNADNAANAPTNAGNASNNAAYAPNNTANAVNNKNNGTGDTDNAANASNNAPNARNNADIAPENADNAPNNAANAVNNINNGTGDAVNVANAPNNADNAPTDAGNASNNADNAPSNAANALNRNNGAGDADNAANAPNNAANASNRALNALNVSAAQNFLRNLIPNYIIFNGNDFNMPEPNQNPNLVNADPNVLCHRNRRRNYLMPPALVVPYPDRVPHGLLLPAARPLPLIDRASLVTDTAIHRFGRADGDNVNFIHIGGNGRDDNARPDRSNLRILSVTGYRRIGDSSLVHLATSAPFLRQLDVSNTAVSVPGIERFKALRPEVDVTAALTED